MSQLTEKNISFNWFLKRATPGHWNKNEQLDLLFIPPTIFFSPNVYLLPLAVATLQFVAACRTIPAFDKVATYKQLKTKSPLPHPHQLKRNPHTPDPTLMSSPTPMTPRPAASSPSLARSTFGLNVGAAASHVILISASELRSALLRKSPDPIYVLSCLRNSEHVIYVDPIFLISKRKNTRHDKNALLRNSSVGR